MHGRYLRMLAGGILFLLADFQVQGYDVLPDAAGFLLVAAGAAKLASRSPWFLLACGVGVAALAMEAVALVGNPPSWPVAAATVLLPLLVVAGCGGVDGSRQRVRPVRRDGVLLSLLLLFAYALPTVDEVVVTLVTFAALVVLTLVWLADLLVLAQAWDEWRPEGAADGVPPEGEALT